ncbi:MAG: hypothetical protein ACFFCV_12310 [Promethearchaeota archaeon]
MVKMVSLAEIKSSLLNEENILWEKQNYTNVLGELKFTLNIFIFTIGISIFSILFYFLTSTVDLEFLLSLPILLTLLLISGFPLYLFIRIYYVYKKIALNLELKLNSLRKFEEFFILTNKRWIQKSFYLAKIDDFINDNEQIMKQKDLAIFYLNNIEVIYVIPQRKNKVYQINFFKSWDKKKEESLLHIFLDKADHQRLIKSLHEIFQIIKKEQDIIKDGDIAYYCKKK